MINFTDAQKDQVRAWLHQGLQLAEIQTRLATELGVSLTYRDLKLLVSELDLVPQDREPAPSTPTLGTSAPATPPPARPTSPARPEPAAPQGRVSLTVDQLTQPGAMVSGSVTFSDGQAGRWFVDEMGRLSVAAPSQPGYRPPPGDMPEFQRALERELARAGF